MIHKTNIALITLALAVCVSTAFAQTLLLQDDFSGPNLPGWTTGVFPGDLTEVNQQLVISENFFGPMQTNNLLATFTGAMHSIPIAGPLPDHQTLELRADLVGANQGDARAGVHYFDGVGQGYIFGKSQNVVTLFKFWDGGVNNAGAVFFYEHPQLKNQNVTLVLALTRLGSSLRITTRVLDKDNANAVLFERTVTDTSQADPVLPNRGADGSLSYPDRAGTPWPVTSASGNIVLSLTWINPTRAPQPDAQVIYDNAEVWQYESPQLTIQNAVVLSWPLTQGQFVLESASSVNGTWATVPDPWWRTNAGQNQVSILAPDSLKLFRLRQTP
jgi:hypothetical protein